MAGPGGSQGLGLGLDWRGSVQGLRQRFLAMTRTLEPDAPLLAEVRELSLPSAAGPIRARLYVPVGAGLPPGPGIVFYHGGGFTVGDLESHDMVARRLADASRCRVLAVDYRRAPEHRFPAAVDDALAAFAAAASDPELGLDPGRLAVAGDSAGGTLAAVVCQQRLAAGEAVRPRFQLLFYPLLQLVDIAVSRMDFKDGLLLSAGTLEVVRRSYLPPGQDPADVRVSPLLNPDLKGLPPAHVLTCGWDPLKDEGRAYADRLAAAGVAVTTRHYADEVHGFLNLTAVSRTAREVLVETGRIVAGALG